MFQRLLVPLDGSGLAEAALRPAEALAVSLGASVTLFHVLERNAPAQVHGDRHLSSPAEAAEYLEQAARPLQAKGLAVDWHVHDVAEPDVAQSITRHAEAFHTDLIVLCTHGSGGVRDLVFGTIAQQVIGHGPTPVLIVRPESLETEFRCRRIVIPLDGSPYHESSVPAAAELARLFDATVHLMTVVPRRSELAGTRAAVGRMLPTAMAALLDAQADEAAAHLSGLVGCLQTGGVAAGFRVERGEPATQVLQSATRMDVDLLVLATHTRRGWDAFWSGSVAPRLLAQWTRPALLVRAVPK